MLFNNLKSSFSNPKLFFSNPKLSFSGLKFLSDNSKMLPDNPILLSDNPILISSNLKLLSSNPKLLFENQNSFAALSNNNLLKQIIKKPTTFDVVGWMIDFVCSHGLQINAIGFRKLIFRINKF